MEKILLTGCAGFIGYHLSKKLLNQGYEVIGIDNINDYYDVSLKKARLDLIPRERFSYIQEDISNKSKLIQVFDEYSPSVVVNLAAQAGVRYSIENPGTYIKSNIQGFHNVLEACRLFKPKHLLFASSSSVYGMNESIPFSEDDRTDFPVSLYAATKKSNETMAFTYSHLFGIPISGLRFFTVYGPFGRPDMAYFKFTKAIFDEEPIEVYNEIHMKRDFTYIDDIVEGIAELVEKSPRMKKHISTQAEAAFEIFNIGNNSPVSLHEFIATLENLIGKKANKIKLGMQPGDVLETFADVNLLSSKVGYQPKTNIKEGLTHFVKWYREYYKFN